MPEKLSLTSGQATCPDAESVALHLRELIRQTQITVRRSRDEADVAIIDMGNSYRIRMLQQQRDIEDRERHCEERARVAAVAIALILDPPIPSESVMDPDTDSVKPAEEATREVPVLKHQPAAKTTSIPLPKPEGRAHDSDLRLDAGFQLAQGHGASTFSGLGAGMRFAYMPRAFGFALGTAWQTGGSIRLGEGTVKVIRVPFDVSIEWTNRSGDWELAPSLGVAVAALHFRGDGYATPMQAWRADSGTRVGLALRRYIRANWGIGLDGSCAFFPRQYAITTAEPKAEVRTPHWWFGLALAASWRSN